MSVLVISLVLTVADSISEVELFRVSEVVVVVISVSICVPLDFTLTSSVVVVVAVRLVLRVVDGE